MTLIEVMAALALLGSLAVAMVLSRGRLVEQHRSAEQKADAVKVVDELLSQWWAGDIKEVPVNEGGALSQAGWVWETQAMMNRSLAPFDAQVVRLRILDASMPGEPVELTSVDLVMPVGPEAGRP